MEIFFLLLNRNMLWHISFPAGCGWDSRTKSRGQGGYGQLRWEQNASSLSWGDLAQPAAQPCSPPLPRFRPPASVSHPGWGLDTVGTAASTAHPTQSLAPPGLCKGRRVPGRSLVRGASLSQRAHHKASSRQRHAEAPRTCGPRRVFQRLLPPPTHGYSPPRPHPSGYSIPTSRSFLARQQELPAPDSLAQVREAEAVGSGAAAGRLPAGLVLALPGPDLRYQSEPWSSHLRHGSMVASASRAFEGVE